MDTTIIAPPTDMNITMAQQNRKGIFRAVRVEMLGTEQIWNQLMNE
jgi:hypothetical protein